jgi:hypothetical protein
MKSREGREVMNRFLDHDHCEGRARSEGAMRKSTEKTRGGKWFVCGEAREGTSRNARGHWTTITKGVKREKVPPRHGEKERERYQERGEREAARSC